MKCPSWPWPARRRRIPSVQRPLRTLGDTASAAYLEVLRARLLARAELLARRGRFAEAAQVAATVPSGNQLLQGEAMRLRGELVAPRFRLRRGGKER